MSFLRWEDDHDSVPETPVKGFRKVTTRPRTVLRGHNPLENLPTPAPERRSRHKTVGGPAVSDSQSLFCDENEVDNKDKPETAGQDDVKTRRHFNANQINVLHPQETPLKPDEIKRAKGMFEASRQRIFADVDSTHTPSVQRALRPSVKNERQLLECDLAVEERPSRKGRVAPVAQDNDIFAAATLATPLHFAIKRVDNAHKKCHAEGIMRLDFHNIDEEDSDAEDIEVEHGSRKMVRGIPNHQNNSSSVDMLLSASTQPEEEDDKLNVGRKLVRAPNHQWTANVRHVMAYDDNVKADLEVEEMEMEAEAEAEQQRVSESRQRSLLQRRHVDIWAGDQD